MPCKEERLHPPAPPGCKAATGNSRGSQGCSRAGDTKETRKISSCFSGSFPPFWPPSHCPPTHKNLYFAQLAPVSREAAQNPASSISAELQHVFANLQIESDISANKEPLFLPICPGSHSSNKFPTTQNQALGHVRRHLWALPVHPGATGPAAAPAPSCVQTCCSTLGNHRIFIFNFWIDPYWEKLCVPIFFMCLSCHLLERYLLQYFFPSFPQPRRRNLLG